MAVLNPYVTDAIIRRQVHIEGLKNGQSAQYRTVLDQVRRALVKALNRYDVERLSDLTKAQIAEIIREVDKANKRANERYISALLVFADRFAIDEARFNRDLMIEAVGREETPSIDTKRVKRENNNTAMAATGLTIGAALAALLLNQRDKIKQAIRAAFVRSLTPRQLRVSIVGTASRNFRNGLFATLLRAATAETATIIQHSSSIGRFEVISRMDQIVLGYQWVSVLDSRTSQICRSLSGRIFQFGRGPIPPIHLNCRSLIAPLFARRVNFRDRALRRQSTIANNSDVTYYQWLRTQPRSFQDQVLGPTLGSLFRQGDLSAEEFGRLNLGRNFEPLTIEQMRARMPELFEDV